MRQLRLERRAPNIVKYRPQRTISTVDQIYNPLFVLHGSLYFYRSWVLILYKRDVRNARLRLPRHNPCTARPTDPVRHNHHQNDPHRLAPSGTPLSYLLSCLRAHERLRITACHLKPTPCLLVLASSCHYEPITLDIHSSQTIHRIL